MKTTIKTFAAASAILVSSFAMASEEEPKESYIVEPTEDLCVYTAESVRWIAALRVSGHTNYEVKYQLVEVLKSTPWATSDHELILDVVYDLVYNEFSVNEWYMTDIDDLASQMYTSCMGKIQ